MSINITKMSHEDLILEEEIERKFSIFCNKDLPMSQRKEAMYEMTQLIKQRGDDVIEQMEKEKGLQK